MWGCCGKLPSDPGRHNPWCESFKHTRLCRAAAVLQRWEKRWLDWRRYGMYERVEGGFNHVPKVMDTPPWNARWWLWKHQKKLALHLWFQERPIYLNFMAHMLCGKNTLFSWVRTGTVFNVRYWSKFPPMDFRKVTPGQTARTSETSPAAFADIHSVPVYEKLK